MKERGASMETHGHKDMLSRLVSSDENRQKLTDEEIIDQIDNHNTVFWVWDRLHHVYDGCEVPPWPPKSASKTKSTSQPPGSSINLNPQYSFSRPSSSYFLVHELCAIVDRKNTWRSEVGKGQKARSSAMNLSRCDSLVPSVTYNHFSFFLVSSNGQYFICYLPECRWTMKLQDWLPSWTGFWERPPMTWNWMVYCISVIVLVMQSTSNHHTNHGLLFTLFFAGFVLIPKGWRVYVYTRELNYTPHVYPDPLVFNPWRWLVRKPNIFFFNFF